ncbi:hypothetical protein [Pelagerythrobacter marinus]|uniref:hypothetical protein n=1 Tax=Pelagerythrobacter marinus TaxID=538382 RepID=UPI0020368CB0|nr:hypothetical protein [Pelagerythrobacter marinus]USA38378.1 hypothetical protein NCF86_08505 [Pelagerythrobacter marinus]WPZ07657.1 hypothetical protein T8T98_03840 [Pelagerythrobacter marinus]
MRIDPAIAALRGDPAAGRPAQAAIERALAAWRREPAVAAACAELAAYGEGGALARYPALAALVEAREAANAFVDPLLARVAGVLRRHPLAQLPFRHQAGEGVALLQLARAGRATLSLIGYDPAATRLAPRSVCFTDSHRHEICLAGRGRAQRVTLAAPTRGGAGLALADVALAPGTRMDFAGARATKIVRQVQRSVVLLRLTRVARVPGESREYRLSDGALLHRAAGTARESRRELALALLGRMARADALPLMLDAARSGSDSARWQALRECLALDSGAGFSALARIARDPADPLAGPAAALRDDLLARHPVLAAAEGEGGGDRCPAR